MVKVHPLMKELNIPRGESPKTTPGAYEVLDYLLRQKIVTDDAVRSAYSALVEERSKAVDEKKVSTVPSPQIRTRHVALEIFYDGEKYSGLAENVGQDSDQSIERALFTALQKCQFITSRESAHYSRCGRTDKGVSAAGQVVALHLKSAFGPATSWDPEGKDLVQDEQLPKNSLDAKTVYVPPRKAKSASARQKKELTELAYDQVLNNLLPPEIRVLGWTPVSDEFSARFSAGSRTYRYFFHRRSMNVENMRKGLSCMVGTHDFRNLCKLNVEEVSNFERKIHQAEITPLRENDQDDLYRVEILGQAFLWHQIRCIVSVLFMIGRGQEEPEVVKELLDVQKHPGKPSYPLADEKPLVLHHCAFENLQFGYTMRNLWGVTCHQKQRWEDFALAAARIQNSFDKMGNSKVRVSDLQNFCLERIKVRRKKAEKYGQECSVQNVKVPFATELISWKEALEWMEGLALFPEPDGVGDVVHVPLLNRSKGTSYEEKVASLQNKRKSRFEENTINKRTTKEEDKAFYEHMTKQGGSAFD